MTNEVAIAEKYNLLPMKNQKAAANIVARLFLDCQPAGGDDFSKPLMESYIEKAARLPEGVLRETVRYFCDGKHGSGFAPSPAEFYSKGDQLWTEELVRVRRRESDDLARQEAKQAEERERLWKEKHPEFEARRADLKPEKAVPKPKKIKDTPKATAEEKATAEYFSDQGRAALLKSLENRKVTKEMLKDLGHDG